ncbi:MAG: hypothetical protein NTU94_16840 [Planctomycetota bacterium]|nr:hypothetical protein [Planctomycetota bacterium]
MTQTSPTEAPAPQGGAASGVMDATRMGWRLMRSDFWALWVVALVEMLIAAAAGSVLGIFSVILVVPPLAAGMFYVVARRIDGGPAEVGDLFAGFQKRFGQSVLGFLPVSLASMVFAMLLGAVIAAAIIIGLAVAEAARGDEEIAIAAVILGILAVLVIGGILFIAVQVFTLFFEFVFPAVWDHPESGWAAAKASARLVRQHFLSVVGLVLLFMVIGMAAQLIGMLACCIGVFFTGPVVVVWQTATMIYLYRAWTGRPGGAVADGSPPNART